MRKFKNMLFCLMSFVISESAYNQLPDTSKLENLSLKDLLNLNITTATKSVQSVKLASSVVTVITREQIRMRGYQSLLDVMYDLQDVKVDDKMYSGIRNSFTIRGTQGSEKFIILLDGVNISSPSGEAMPIMQNYPVNLAEQIEVLYGPASALYGANAMSGIINIITRKPIQKKLIIDASVSSGDYGYTNTTLFMSKDFGEKTGLVFSGQYFYDRNPDYSKVYKSDSLSNISSYSTGQFNTIFGTFIPTTPVKPKFEAPMEAYNLYLGFHSGDFSLSFFRNYSKIPTAFGNNTINAIFNKEVFMGQSITTANAAYKKTLGKLTTSSAMTVSRYDLDPKSNYRNLYTGMEPAYKYSTCTMIKGEEQLDYKYSKKLDLIAGVGYEDYSSIPQSGDLANPVNRRTFINGSYMGTASYYRPEGLPAPFYFIRYNNIGAYFQAQVIASQKLRFTLGTRYDRNSRFGSTFNPRLGIVFQPQGNTTIKLMYGSAYRAPAPSDSYTQYGSFETLDSGRTYHSYFLHLPNPGLKPVRSYNTELNIQHQVSDNLSITVDGYYTFISGLYAFADDNQTSRLYNNEFNGIPVDYIEVFINNDRQKNYGGSFSMNWKTTIQRAKLNVFASVSYVNGVKESGMIEREETIKDVQLDFISPIMVRLGADIKVQKFSCSPRLLLTGRQNISGIGDTTGAITRRQTIPGYALLNVSFRYNMSRSCSLFANVNNALNQRYRAVSFNMDLSRKETELYYGQPQDPIRITAGINFNL